MATKINVRSPYYLDISEPTAPTIAFDCTVANASGMEVDQFGFITHPNFTQGDIDSFTSSDSGFSNGKYATVSTDTVRTVSYTLLIPEGFTNSDVRTFTCDVQATQPEFVCTGGVSTNGSIPNQSIDAGGNTATIDLSSYFTASGDPISEYKIDNPHYDFIDASISGNTLTLTTLLIGGTKFINIEATDGDPLTCNAIQPIQITVTNLPAFDCTTANLQGGEVAQDGTITDPLSIAEIPTKSLTSGGAHITSAPANTGSTAQNVTIFFDLIVPDGYSNAGDTFICSKTFVQQAAQTLPEFTCSVANITGTNIYKSGAVLRGSAQKGTIVTHEPTQFDEVTVATPRTVSYTITPPSSGYSNSGGSNILCSVNLNQPAVPQVDVSGYYVWGMGDKHFNSQSDLMNFMTQGGDQYSSPSGSRFARPVGLAVYPYSTNTNETYFSANYPGLVGTVTADVGNYGRSGRYFIQSAVSRGRFMPVYIGVTTRWSYGFLKTITVLEVIGSSIIGVWQYNNNRYSSGYKSFTKIH